MIFSQFDVRNLRVNSAPTWHRCVPDWSWAPSAMPDYDFWFVAGGQGEIELESSKYPLLRGSFFLWRPNELPAGKHDPTHPLRVFSCHFDCVGAPKDSFILPRPFHLSDLNFFETTAHRCEELWRRGSDDSQTEAKRLLLSLLHMVFDEVASPIVSRDEAIEAIANLLKTDFTHSWTLDEMAGMAHLSRSQVVRRFRARFDVSPLKFLNQVRLENARRMLLETDWTLDKIAVQSGFCDAAHFSNAFKNYTGFAPGMLRKR
jgi:AraC family transcriptional regulator of arabinose operon